MNNTNKEYEVIVSKCRDIFNKKMHDYGISWRVLRTSSITDQIYIKAQRIRSIEIKGVSKINEDCHSEYIGIINYCIMALIQLEKGYDNEEENNLTPGEILKLYDKFFLTAKELMQNKNHDYDEAWRKIRISSITDLIMMKINRTKQIEDNDGKTIISEGIDANYLDMINYAVFALIRLNEKV